MVLIDIPPHLENGIIPQRIYCHKQLASPILSALELLYSTNLLNGVSALSLLKTYDGCFNVRKKRGASTMSLHSWGLAIDFNAKTNAFGAKPTMPKIVVDAFKANGFDWGGDWLGKPDGMHFQIKYH
jgi:hypothetical protein